jgi:long-subunit acyl-CoA synthetase (AMP-forming)
MASTEMIDVEIRTETKGDRTAPASVGTVDSDGILWKSTATPGKFSSDFGGCSNLWETLEKSVQVNGTRPTAGLRPILTTTVVDGFDKYTLGPYEWLTYNSYFEQVSQFGAGLPARIPSLSKGDTIVIYAETQRAWMQAAYGAWRQGLVVGTIYATLGDEGALFGINQSQCKAVVADNKLLKVLAKICSAFTSLKDVISIGDPPAGEVEKLQAAGITIHTMSEVMAAGAAASPSDDLAAPPSPCAPEDAAVLMYTSGTTGNPKGVLITHAAILATLSGTFSSTSALTLGSKKYLTNESVYLAYLPLAHIMELAVEVGCFANGAKVGYGSPGTIAGTSIKMLQTKKPQVGDAAACAPTVFVAAPAVLDKLLIAIKAKFAAAPGCLQGAIAGGIEAGKANYAKGGVGTTKFIAKKIFKKAQKLLGGRVELMLTGSAPLGVEVQMFCQTVFNCRVRQGFGLTETCAATCIALASDNATQTVGPPQESACIKLRDWEEGGYKNDDLHTPEIGMRRGEVLIGGPTIASGYLTDPANPDPEIEAKNANDFVTIDGIRYFCTGDIGQFTPAGNLQIIDRKKDLVKLQMGEYVALSKVENTLKSCKYTALPMTYALSSSSYIIALICPNKKPIEDLGASLGLGGTSFDELCTNEQVTAAVLADVQATCKKAKLAKFETPSKIILISELWTPENDMLTAVQKLKRREIVAKHKAEIDAVYT